MQELKTVAVVTAENVTATVHATAVAGVRVMLHAHAVVLQTTMVAVNNRKGVGLCQLLFSYIRFYLYSFNFNHIGITGLAYGSAACNNNSVTFI